MSAPFVSGDASVVVHHGFFYHSVVQNVEQEVGHTGLLSRQQLVSYTVVPDVQTRGWDLVVLLKYDPRALHLVLLRGRFGFALDGGFFHIGFKRLRGHRL
jgi:hypothetical protein